MTGKHGVIAGTSVLQLDNSYLSELSGAPLMLPSKKCNCLKILTSDVIRDVKHLLAPGVIHCLSPVEHGPKKRCFGPWRLCGIGESHVIRPLGGPEAERKCNAICWRGRFTPLAEADQTAYMLRFVPGRVLKVVNSVRVTVICNKTREANGLFPAALAGGNAWWFKLDCDHIFLAPDTRGTSRRTVATV